MTSAGPAKNLLDLPARGFEFWEAGQSLGAVQYYAGGVSGLNKNVVYLRRDLDPQMKLLLASAMTAIMEYKLEALVRGLNAAPLPADCSAFQNSKVRLSPFIALTVGVAWPPHATEDPTMFTRNNVDRFSARVLSSLVVTVAIVMGSLAYAVSHIQVVA